MAHAVLEDSDFITIRDLPAGSIIKLMSAIAAGAGLFLFAFHVFAWAFGWPSPFLWFGNASRWSDIVSVTLGLPLSILTFSILGLTVVKALALADWLNFKFKVR